MPTPNFKASPEQIAQTIQRSMNSTDHMATQFKMLDQRTDEVVPLCAGAGAAALGESLSQLKTQRDQLIGKLRPILEQMKSAGGAVGSQDSQTATAIRGKVASTLNG
jgi:uncharacterized protein YukE